MSSQIFYILRFIQEIYDLICSFHHFNVWRKIHLSLELKRVHFPLNFWSFFLWRNISSGKRRKVFPGFQTGLFNALLMGYINFFWKNELYLLELNISISVVFEIFFSHQESVFFFGKLILGSSKKDNYQPDQGFI